MTQVVKQTGSRSWHARLDLEFEYRHGRTMLSGRQHEGPLVVQRPFYPEGDVCHVYMIHPPGGVVGGDRLDIQVDLKPSSHALITTPSAGKFYRSAGDWGYQSQTLSVADGALLEWLPQENIFFSGSYSDIKTQIEIQQHGQFIGWEMSCLGRPAADELFEQGTALQRLKLFRDGKPLYIERNEFVGGSELLNAVWGMNQQPLLATFIATGCDAETLRQIRDRVQVSDATFAATLLDDVLICRYLGHHAEWARRSFIEVWHMMRHKHKQKAACPPRIWQT